MFSLFARHRQPLGCTVSKADEYPGPLRAYNPGEDNGKEQIGRLNHQYDSWRYMLRKNLTAEKGGSAWLGKRAGAGAVSNNGQGWMATAGLARCCGALYK